MGLCIWRHFRIDVPDDWEMLQFTRERPEGRCAFGDRYQIRLEMSWRSSTGSPDLRRSITDYISKLREQESMPDAERLDRHGWVGLDGHMGALRNTRFMKAFSRESAVVQLVFLWPNGRDPEVEGRVLRSVRDDRPSRNGLRRWKTFGLDVHARDGLELSGCTVEPAHVTMRFGDDRSAHREEYRRLGMVEQWLDGPVERWLRLQLPPNVRIDSDETEELRGHRYARISGTRPAEGLKLLLGQRRRFETSAWVCPTDGRLYMTRHEGTSTDSGVDPHEPRVTCCGGPR